MKKLLSLLLALLMLGTSFAMAEGAVDYEADAVAIAEALLTGGDTDAIWERCAPAVQGQISKADLGGLAAQLEAAGGKFVAIQGSQAIGSIVTMGIEMENMMLTGQIVFDAQGLIAGLGFVPAAEAPEEIALEANEEEVTVGPKALAGTLSIPEGAQGKVPAVVLVHGSGASDRNEAIGNLAVFRDIAQGLCERGVAVLRYDKRTYAWGTGALAYTDEELENLTVYEETIEDAVAAVRMLREDARIDPERVYVLGHSQGGMLASRIQADAQADGLIILAGTLRHLNELMADQLQALADQGMAGLEADIETARDLPTLTEEEARQLMLLGSGAYPAWEEAQHDLVAAAEAVDVPMLILQGTEDVQVYADVDYVLWEEFAAAHPDKHIDLKLYEGLGHLFNVDEHVAPVVIEDIAGWILAR